MLKQRRFIISYILDNQPESIDIHTDAEAISEDDARMYIHESHESKPANITDIQIIGIHHHNNSEVIQDHDQLMKS